MLEYLQKLLSPLRRSEDGASAVEYGLLVAGIAALVVAVVFLLGGAVTGSMKTTCGKIKTGTDTATSANCT